MTDRDENTAFTTSIQLHVHNKPPASRWQMCDVDLRPPPRAGSYGARFTTILDKINLPKPVTLRRRTLEQPFAVTLMRSGYNAVDVLDIVGMDEYQKQFFDVRSLAWSRYKKDNPAVIQGRLADPRYFDFISYAQMCTTLRFVRSPAALFTEAYADNDGIFRERVVRRDVTKLPTADDILHEFRRETGRRILDALELGVGDTVGFEFIISKLYARFDREGYCLTADKTMEDEGRTCIIELIAPATLWGVTALKRQRGICTDYDVFAVQVSLDDAGILADVTTDITPTSIIRRWRLL